MLVNLRKDHNYHLCMECHAITLTFHFLLIFPTSLTFFPLFFVFCFYYYYVPHQNHEGKNASHVCKEFKHPSNRNHPVLIGWGIKSRKASDRFKEAIGKHPIKRGSYMVKGVITSVNEKTLRSSEMPIWEWTTNDYKYFFRIHDRVWQFHKWS